MYMYIDKCCAICAMHTYIYLYNFYIFLSWVGNFDEIFPGNRNCPVKKIGDVNCEFSLDV